MSEEDFVALLDTIILESAGESYASVYDNKGRKYIDIRHTLTFQEAGLLTSDRGLVIRMSNGDEFQVSINRSR